MLCQHLHCQSRGLPHVIGVSEFFLDVSLVGPTIKRCPAKLGIWVQTLHSWSLGTVLKLVSTSQRQSNPCKYPKKYGCLFKLNFHPKNLIFEFWQLEPILWLRWMKMGSCNNRHSGVPNGHSCTYRQLCAYDWNELRWRFLDNAGPNIHMENCFGHPILRNTDSYSIIRRYRSI